MESISLDEAKKLQFHIIDCITKEFKGGEIITRGDLGVRLPYGRPLITIKAEKVIARIFKQEDCILVRGAGTSAIRFGFSSIVKAGDKILIHKAPIYSTTKDSIEMLGLKTIEADYNNLDDIEKVLLDNEDIKLALVQYTRQLPNDNYDISRVIKKIKDSKNIPIITDDNYAALKVKNIGVELGADLSCFSSFKLLGPEGIGIVVGKKKYIDKIRSLHYSGGMQVQGHESIDVLRGMVYAPVSLAIQGEVVKECFERLNNGEVDGVKKAYIANSQSKVLLVEFDSEIAEEVCINAEKLGAAPYPVGSESKYEFVPMFYRVSGTFLKFDESLKTKMIRINPMRAGADTILNILDRSIKGCD